jgi:hypothetical protein
METKHKPTKKVLFRLITIQLYSYKWRNVKEVKHTLLWGRLRKFSGRESTNRIETSPVESKVIHQDAAESVIQLPLTPIHAST